MSDEFLTQLEQRTQQVKITLAKDHFSIEDNCGGIPREVAKNYAA